MKKLSPLHETDIFLLHADSDRYYLYAPLQRAVAMVNASAVNVVKRYISSGDTSLNKKEIDLINTLRDKKFFVDSPIESPKSLSDETFHPCEVTLFPTTRCNLNCSYCYADAGKRANDMPWDMAKAAIDFVVENAELSELKDCGLGFHGDGEPSQHWSVIHQAVDYIEDISAKKGLKPHIHIASNGLLTFEQREYITQHFASINISLDGPAHIQNRQRPQKNGSPSFDRVMDTVKHFEELNFLYGIRATITESSMPYLKDILYFCRENCPSIDQLHVEPVWYCGRCRTTGIRPPDEMDFTRYFLEAWEEGHRIGLELFYSGARIESITNTFCAAAGNGFSVTSEGRVTSCFEVTKKTDPRAEIFHYGYYDKDTGRYILDQNKIKKLRQLTVENMPHCQDCFCKWHCAGDCLSKVMSDSSQALHKGSIRCELNRKITLAEIEYLIKSSANNNFTLNGTVHASQTE